MSALLFVPVPGGVAPDGTATLRVLVVPRLDTGSVAGNGLAAWPPDELRGPLQVDLTPDGGATATIEVTPRLTDQPGLWPLVFGAATVTPPAPPDPADAVTVVSTTGAMTWVQQTYQQAAQAYAGAAGAAGAGPAGAAGAAGAGHESALTAYAATVADRLRSSSWSRPPLPPPHRRLDATDPPPPTDVNRLYGALREHPRVLAALGLLLELDLPRTSIPSGPGVVRVRWGSATDVTPALPPVVARAAAYDGTTFLPVSHDGSIASGLVRLDQAAWQLAALDVDAAVQRLHAAANAGPPPGPALAPTDGPSATTLPTLRTAGLMLIHADRAATFAQRRTRSVAMAADADPVLYAEDLVLGYRLDVQVFGDHDWSPLCTREATYRIDDVVVGTAGAVEEGHIKAHAAQRDEQGRLVTDEIVTRWDGWSLAVPLPFPASAPGSGSGDASGLPYRLDADFTVPAGTLPGLRFGSTYAVRARVADLADGGIGPDDPSAAGYPTAPFTFRRYEPVAAPSLLLAEGTDQDSLGPGAHVAQLVVTSAGGDPATPATGLPATGLPATPTDRRVLSQPTVPLTTAEWHGALTGDADATWPVAQLALAGTLPDPAAAGLAGYVVPGPGGLTGGPVGWRWPTWPAATAGAVELRAHPLATPAPVLDWDDGVLAVTLPPAQEVDVQVSSTMSSDDVAHFAVGGWSDDAGVAAAITGRHPMLTPPVTVHCVHAVQRPVRNPTADLTAARGPGAVPAVLTPAVPMFGIDPASTGQVDLTASWTEVTDDIRADLADVPVQSLVVNLGDSDFTDRVQHHLPDTRHRDITYTVSAVSRFRAYFPAGADADFAAVSLPVAAVVPSTARPTAPLVRAVVPAFAWETAVGTTITRTRHGNRIRVELDRPWFSSGDDEQLALVLTPAEARQGTPGTTEAGRDPLWLLPDCPRWPRAAAVVGSGDPAVARVTTVDGVAVDVVPAQVVFDAAAGRWFADFELPGVAGSSYTPLLRPALARYQRHSLAGLELSAVVLGDFVPVLPDRTLTVTLADATHLAVTLTGLGPPQPWPNAVHLTLESGGWASDLTATTYRQPGWKTRSIALDTGLPGPIAGVLGETITVALPANAIGDLRLRVREIELDETESVMGTAGEGGERAVFVDTVLLSQLVVPTAVG